MSYVSVARAIFHMPTCKHRNSSKIGLALAGRWGDAALVPTFLDRRRDTQELFRPVRRWPLPLCPGQVTPSRRCTGGARRHGVGRSRDAAQCEGLMHVSKPPREEGSPLCGRDKVGRKAGNPAELLRRPGGQDRPQGL